MQVHRQFPVFTGKPAVQKLYIPFCGNYKPTAQRGRMYRRHDLDVDRWFPRRAGGEGLSREEY